MRKVITSKPFYQTLLVNALWQNCSEIARYFIFVMPLMRTAFPQIPDIAPMNLEIFALWSVWGLLLLLGQTLFTWTHLCHFGNTYGNALIIGTIIWAAIFGVLWMALYNMNLAPITVLRYALPLSWIEMLVSALIVSWGMHHFTQR